MISTNTTTATKSAVAIAGALLLTLALQAVLGWMWPRDIDGLQGAALWSWAACGSSACLTSLATNPDADRRLPGLVLLLAHGALLGVAFGSVLPGVLSLVVDLGRCPPMAELELLLAGLQRLVVPLPIVLTAMPAPMLALVVFERSRRGPAFASAVWLLLLLGVMIARARGWAQLEGAVLEHGAQAAHRSAWRAQLAWSIPCVLAWALSWVLLVRERLWSAWVASLLTGGVLLDPAALVAGRIYDAASPGMGLHQTSSAGLGSALPLLELDREQLRYGGEIMAGDLLATLAEHGFTDLGEGTLVQQPPRQPWQVQAQRAVHMAPEPGATCGDLVEPMRVLRRHWVTVWLWPGISPLEIRGGLGAAFARPAVAVLTYPPPRGSEVSTCPELILRPRGLYERSGERLVSLPEELDALPGALGDCHGSVVLAPTEDTSAALLFQVLDRLGGTHPSAPHRGRLALRWPRLDPSGDGVDSQKEESPS
jgi:hypothetical protein